MEQQLNIRNNESDMPILERNEPDTAVLLNLLNGPSPEYDFELIALKPFPSPICKGKYIRFEVGLNALSQTAIPPKALEL